MMAPESHNEFYMGISKKKFLGFTIICLLILIGINPSAPFSELFDNTIKGEYGAPAINGSTTKIWYIEEGEIVNRSHENIITKDIILNGSSILNWENITAEVNGNVTVKSNAIFNLSNCNLTLSGDLTISGVLNAVNTTILVNCSTMGEFFVSVEKSSSIEGGTLNLTGGSTLSGPSNNQRIRVLWVDSASKFQVENCWFRYIGWTPNYKGVLIEGNESIIKNCTFTHCYPGISLYQCNRAIIENCEFSNSTAALNLSRANNNIIRNCTFYANDFGFYCENSSQNLIIDSKAINNTQHGIALLSMSSNNNIRNVLIENNDDNGLVINNLSENINISYCHIKNNNGTGITCSDEISNIKIMNTTLKNNGFGLKSENGSKNLKIINSSIINSNTLDFYLSNYSELWILNTSFDRDKIQVISGSNLSVQWYLHIRTMNSTFTPIPNSNLTIVDNENGSWKQNYTTDSHGWVRWLVGTEFYETETVRTNLTPHTISAKKFGFETNLTKTQLSSSKTINIILNRTIPLLPDLVPIRITFSNDYPRRNQLITITTEIKNAGLADFDSNQTNVSIAIYSDSTLINVTTNISSIPADDTIEIAVPWTVNVTNGSHNIFIYIDIDANLTELNKTNNSIFKQLIVISIPVAILELEPNRTFTFENILFNASRSYNEVVEVGIEFYFYEFGDGTNSGWVPNNRFYHNYSDNGTYIARLKVRDSTFQESAWSAGGVLEIMNRAPVANFTIEPSSGTVETEFTFDPGLAQDRDGFINKYLWNLSDGSISNDQILVYKFGNDIEYTISLTVWDDDGAVSESYVKHLRILNLPPIAFFEVTPRIPNATEEIIFDASGTRDPDDELYTLDYTWDFDDGSFVYNQSITQHNYSKPGIYNVTLFVRDDDGESGKFVLSILVNDTAQKPSDGKSDSNMLWAVGLVVLVLVIFLVLILFVFYTQSQKIRKQLTAEQKLGTGPDGAAEFTTAGKLDFVIMKRSVGKRYIKLELHKTTKSTNEYLGIIWKSAFLNNSWLPIEKTLDTKDKVIDYLQLKIMAYNNKGWVIDYEGNGTITSKQFSVVTSTVPLKTIELQKPPEQVGAIEQENVPGNN
ncbi:PKD domain-containing protein [[Eubacterium] cellulosolvens]